MRDPFAKNLVDVMLAPADGVGIRDGRGYGPYGQGYHITESGEAVLIGPDGELLSSEYDFQPGADGSFISAPEIADAVGFGLARLLNTPLGDLANEASSYRATHPSAPPLMMGAAASSYRQYALDAFADYRHHHPFPPQYLAGIFWRDEDGHPQSGGFQIGTVEEDQIATEIAEMTGTLHRNADAAYASLASPTGHVVWEGFGAAPSPATHVAGAIDASALRQLAHAAVVAYRKTHGLAAQAWGTPFSIEMRWDGQALPKVFPFGAMNREIRRIDDNIDTGITAYALIATPTGDLVYERDGQATIDPSTRISGRGTEDADESSHARPTRIAHGRGVRHAHASADSHARSHAIVARAHADAAAEYRRLAIDAEADRRFWAITHFRPGQKLDPHEPLDRTMIPVWLEIAGRVADEYDRDMPAANAVLYGADPIAPANAAEARAHAAATAAAVIARVADAAAGGAAGAIGDALPDSTAADVASTIANVVSGFRHLYPVNG